MKALFVVALKYTGQTKGQNYGRDIFVTVGLVWAAGLVSHPSGQIKRNPNNYLLHYNARVLYHNLIPSDSSTVFVNAYLSQGETGNFTECF